MKLGKDTLNNTEVLIFKALIDSYISHDEFLLVNNVLREYSEMKQEMKKVCVIYYIQKIKMYCLSCKKNTEKENSSVRKTKQNRLMLLSNCAACGKKKSTFIKNKELHNFDNNWIDQFW